MPLFMAITSSAKRAVRVHERKRVVNLRRSRTMKEAVKTVEDSVKKKDGKAAAAAMPAAQKALDKAVKGGIIKAGNASRKKSRLSAAIKKLG